ncbi:hypothetical protein IMZ48_28725 [Candidatus Bathyarchaeota archaeon]|nr:hypothetical protein [Candidatus Bathyarchaeota archaeon]
MPFNGHCLCGQVKYTVDADAPLITAYGMPPPLLDPAPPRTTPTPHHTMDRRRAQLTPS